MSERATAMIEHHRKAPKEWVGTWGERFMVGEGVIATRITGLRSSTIVQALLEFWRAYGWTDNAIVDCLVNTDDHGAFKVEMRRESVTLIGGWARFSELLRGAFREEGVEFADVPVDKI